MSTVVEGVVLCQATAAKCVCDKPDGHVATGDRVHHCGDPVCLGEWMGDYDDPSTFVMVSPPGGMEAVYRMLGGG